MLRRFPRLAGALRDGSLCLTTLAARPPPRNPTDVSAEVRRQVWERDQGRCAWTSPEGKRGDSRWQVEVDRYRWSGRRWLPDDGMGAPKAADALPGQ